MGNMLSQTGKQDLHWIRTVLILTVVHICLCWWEWICTHIHTHRFWKFCMVLRQNFVLVFTTIDTPLVLDKAFTLQVCYCSTVGFWLVSSCTELESAQFIIEVQTYIFSINSLHWILLYIGSVYLKIGAS